MSESDDNTDYGLGDCPQCGATLTVADSEAGKCTQCGKGDQKANELSVEEIG